MVSVNDNVIFYVDWQALLRVVRYIKVFPTEDLFWSFVFWGSMAYVLIGGTGRRHRVDACLPARALRHLVSREPKIELSARKLFFIKRSSSVEEGDRRKVQRVYGKRCGALRKGVKTSSPARDRQKKPAKLFFIHEHHERCH